MQVWLIGINDELASLENPPEVQSRLIQLVKLNTVNPFQNSENNSCK